MLRPVPRTTWLAAAAAAAISFAVLGYFLPAPVMRAMRGFIQHGSTRTALLLCLAMVAGAGLLLEVQRWRKFGRKAAERELRGMRHDVFAAKVAEAFERQGYEVERRPQGRDALLILTKPGRRIVVHWPRPHHAQLDGDHLRPLVATMTAERATGALAITSGEFTLDAIRFARDVPIGLISGSALLELLKLGQPESAASPGVSHTI